MAAKKGKTKQKDSNKRVTEQLEHAFLAGLGALSNAQKAGEKTFDKLVTQGEKFRKETSKKTESLIDDVQDAIRDMTDDAQSKATGLLDQVRDKSNLSKLPSVFDARVADAMDRLNVPSKNDIDAINKKLNKILRLLDSKPAASKPRATAKKKTTKKTAKKVTKKTASKPAKKAA
ncbi:MAG: phasin family protein [Gammaproteobacteria bacterium]|nr:phasin family protein [Gammaproteobacteria bacterium]MDH3417498.1 phasin family protein [Gammaproteobacteria bacterium]